MSYQTILVHVDQSRHAPQRIALACALCAEHGAHLIGAAMTGIARDVFPHGYDVEPHTLLASYVEPLAQTARRSLEAFEAIADRHGISHESRLVCDGVPDGMALLSRYADLVVLSQDDPAESLGYMPPASRMPDYVVVEAAPPVLIVPRTPTAAPACPRRILVCWNGSREASKAMAAAVPLLQRASDVTLAAFAPTFPSSLANGEELADVQTFLGRHGVHAQVALRDPHRDTGRAILALATEQSRDLIVMGCFGHTRFQEILLGGASRTVLQEAGLAVLMTH